MSKLYLIDEAAGILGEAQAWLLAKADRKGWAYTMVLRRLVNHLYRHRQAKRVKHGRHTAYAYALDRGQRALACTVRVLVQCVPLEEKGKSEPPKQPRNPSRNPSPAQRTVYQGATAASSGGRVGAAASYEAAPTRLAEGASDAS